jgi:hypothetical protein
MSMEVGCNQTGGNRSNRRKACLSATLQTISTWTGLESNPGVRGDRPATKCHSRGTTCPLVSTFCPHNISNISNISLVKCTEGYICHTGISQFTASMSSSTNNTSFIHPSPQSTVHHRNYK